MKKIFIFFAVLPLMAEAQTIAEAPKFGISFSGFIKNDFFWDSRQTVSIREGHFLLYPSPVNKDAEGNDINAKPNFNFLSIQTRLTGKISGPDVLNAKTSGVIEADFFGNENAYFVDANGFRLRHSFVKLNWTKTELLFGQYWHPMFNANSFPAVISFNTGAPFQPFSRNPQIRFTQKFGKMMFLMYACSQRDFASPGGSSATLRNSAIPDLGAQLGFGKANESLEREFQVGLGGGYKVVTPRLFSEVSKTTTTVIIPSYEVIDKEGNYHTIPAVNQTTTSTKRYKADEKLGGFYSLAYLKYKCRPVTLKLYGAFGQNIFDHVMLGGYAISGILDLEKDLKEYTPLNTLTVWTEVHTNGYPFRPGLFAGYTQNLGAPEDIISFSNTNRGADIKSIYRVSPRIIFIFGKLQFMTEIEWTSAAYATRNESGVLNRDSKGIITETNDVNNLRALFAIQYNF